MTGLVRKATLLSAAAMLFASAAMAGVPSPANSTVPGAILLAASDGLAPDAFCTFTINVKDLGGNNLNGASVVIDLSGCSEMTFCPDQLDAGLTLVNCGAKTVRKFTDISGNVTFTVVGESNQPAGASNAVTLFGAGKVFANGTLIASPTIAAADLDGQVGYGANDRSTWLTDFGISPFFGRDDIDRNTDVTANDLSVQLTEIGSGFVVSCNPAPPPVGTCL